MAVDKHMMGCIVTAAGSHLQNSLHALHQPTDALKAQQVYVCKQTSVTNKSPEGQPGMTYNTFVASSAVIMTATASCFSNRRIAITLPPVFLVMTLRMTCSGSSPSFLIMLKSTHSSRTWLVCCWSSAPAGWRDSMKIERLRRCLSHWSATCYRFGKLTLP